MNTQMMNFIQREAIRRRNQAIQNTQIAEEYMQNEIIKISQEYDYENFNEDQNEKKNYKELYSQLEERGLTKEVEFDGKDVTIGRHWISVQYFIPQIGCGFPFAYKNLHEPGESLDSIISELTRPGSKYPTHMPIDKNFVEFWSILAGKGGCNYYQLTEVANVAFVYHIKSRDAVIIIPQTNSKDEISILENAADMLMCNMNKLFNDLGLYDYYCKQGLQEQEKILIKSDGENIIGNTIYTEKQLTDFIYNKEKEKPIPIKQTIWSDWKNRLNL